LDHPFCEEPASEGGGGKGIRFVENEEDLKNAYIQVENKDVGSPIFIMQLCKNARHLEVQIVGDEHGMRSLLADVTALLSAVSR
jgi:biotin carboxylase